MVHKNSMTEAIKRLKSNNTEDVTNALLYLTFNMSEFDKVQEFVAKMIDSENEDVAGLAITCLGHLARIHGKIDKKKIIPLLMSKAKNKRFFGRVQDALDDINMFTST